MLTQEEALRLFEYRDGVLYWRVDMRINGKKQYIGLYATLAEAEQVARETRAQHHGEFARHN